MEDRWPNSSSSSSFQQHWNSDVFFSFRSVDTSTSFTAHLCYAFHKKGIGAFMWDGKLKGGEEIYQALINEIEQSRISIIIFSENYASSIWCLDELVKIMEFRKTKGQVVLPVFYKVDPSAVRHQTASFAGALASHEFRFKADSERVLRWRLALKEAANLFGWYLEDGNEFQYIQQITKDVIDRLKSLHSEAENLRKFRDPVSLNRNFSYSADLPGKQLQGFESESLFYMDFRECEFLARIPDMSAAQNLTKLLLDSCINLVEIHESVGFLAKLITLSTRHCWKLERFPRKIRLISLQRLDLFGNYSFQFFPEVLEKMENIIEVSLERTAIKELPYSMGNLSGLRLLELNHCRIRNLPRSIGMLTNLREISMACCPLVFSSLKSNINFGKLRYYLVQKLNLGRCDLFDEDLPVIVHCFPNTKYLDLSKNKFVSISACIIELYYLEKLYLANCKLLEEIEGIPPNLVLLSATNCNRLTSLSTNMLGLVHQESSEKGFEIKLPGRRIPECFNHFIGEGKMSFWVCQNFPDVALCLAFELEEEEKLEGSFYFTCDIWIQVNRLPILQLEAYREFQTSHHVRLIYLHSYIDNFKNVDRPEWSHVEIFWEVKYYQTRLNVTRPGRVHIYGKETDMDDIPSSILSDGGCSFSQTTNDDESETCDSQCRNCSFSRTNDENENYGCLGGDGKRKAGYKDKEADLSIGLLSPNDPITLVCENIWTKHHDFFSHDRNSSILDEKCSIRGQANEAGGIWDPMELEYQVTCQKHQRNNRDKGNDEMGYKQESHWRFSLCALICSLVSLCSSSSLNSP